MNTLPSWAFLLLTLVLVLGTLLLGFRAGRKRHLADPNTPEGPIGAVVGAVLGLMAFMLAFTFSMATERYAARKQLLLDDVNAIGTVALRAELLPEPQRSACKELLRQYVAGRLSVAHDPTEISVALAEAAEIHRMLWTHVRSLEPPILNADIGNLIVDGLNTMIELHRSRVTVAVHYHIPPAVWGTLMLLLALSMLGLGYQFGITGRHNPLLSSIMALSFAVVLGLIYGLDDPTGKVHVDQRPMLELQEELARP